MPGSTRLHLAVQVVIPVRRIVFPSLPARPSRLVFATPATAGRPAARVRRAAWASTRTRRRLRAWIALEIRTRTNPRQSVSRTARRAGPFRRRCRAAPARTRASASSGTTRTSRMQRVRPVCPASSCSSGPRRARTAGRASTRPGPEARRCPPA